MLLSLSANVRHSYPLWFLLIYSTIDGATYEPASLRRNVLLHLLLLIIKDQTRNDVIPVLEDRCLFRIKNSIYAHHVELQGTAGCANSDS